MKIRIKESEEIESNKNNSLVGPDKADCGNYMLIYKLRRQGRITSERKQMKRNKRK